MVKLSDLQPVARPGSGEPHILRTGLIFRAGKYPDKGAEFDKSDIRAMVASFEGPAKVNFEHEGVPPVDIGSLIRVWSESSDTEVHGVLVIPKMVDDVLDDTVGVSVEISGRGKLTGIALTGNPRVLDAAASRVKFSGDQPSMLKTFIQKLKSLGTSQADGAKGTLEARLAALEAENAEFHSQALSAEDRAAKAEAETLKVEAKRAAERLVATGRFSGSSVEDLTETFLMATMADAESGGTSHMDRLERLFSDESAGKVDLSGATVLSATGGDGKKPEDLSRVRQWLAADGILNPVTLGDDK